MNRFLTGLFMLALLSMPCLAQFDTADVLGTIRDSSGAAVPGASVTLHNTQNGIDASATTNDGGEYTFVNVKIGTYTVSAAAKGFSKAVASGVSVAVGARQRIDMTLQPGAVNETIEVSAVASAIETDSSSRGQVINTQQIVELPLNGRNASDLALLTTGVLRSPQSAREGSFNVNGLRSVFSNYLLDGIDNNAYGTSNNGASNQAIQASPDAITEFKVETNNYSAEFGRGGAATTNVVMKSGTNVIHGSAYEFNRNTVFNAVGFFKPLGGVKPPLHQNQFGLTAGGPIIKNKIFAFADYEGFRVKSGALAFASIPTTDEAKGILPVAVTNPLTGAVYPANTPIPQSAMQPFARKILSQYPAPVTAGAVANNYQNLVVTKSNQDKYDVKIDDQIRSDMSVFLRVSQRKVNGFVNPIVPGPNFNLGSFTHVINQQAAAGYVWTVSPTSILEARFAVTRINAGGGPAIVGNVNALDGYGIPGLPTGPNYVGGFNIGGGGLPSMSLSAPFTAIGRGTATPQFQNPLNFDSKVNFTKILGKHTLKVGVEGLLLREQVLDINPFYGKDSFLGSFSQPAGGPANARAYTLADLMFGLRSQYVLSSSITPNFRKHFYYAYAQDDFRVSSKLTLNLGLRWEYGSPWYDRDDKMANFDPSTGKFLLAKAGGVYDRTLVNPQLRDFAPRLGFAWTVTPKTVVRGGYGWTYVHEHRVGSAEQLGIFGPYGPVFTVNQGNVRDPGFLTTQQGYPAGVVDPANFNPLNANSTYIPKDIPDTYIQTWTLDIQRELPHGIVLDFAYVGNHGVAEPLMTDFNQAYAQPSPAANLPLQARRPFATAAAVTCFCPDGFSTYHGLQAKVEKKFSRGFSFINAFTYSHTIDNSDQSLDNSNGNQASPQNYRDMASEKGTSNYDRKLVDIFSVIYDLPVGYGRRYLTGLPAIADALLGGWQISAINTAESGLPINLRAWAGLNVPAAFQTVGNLNDWRGGESYRPNILGPVLNTTPGADITKAYFNTANVVLQTDPSHPFGNAGRNAVRAPGLNQIDLAVHKDFRLPREGMRLQFRAEFFNALNHTNFQAPAGDRASSAFGIITAALPARIGQLALKLVW